MKSSNSGRSSAVSAQVNKGEKRDYEAMPVSEEDAAYVRGLVIHDDIAVLAFNKPSGLPVQTRNVDDRTLDRLRMLQFKPHVRIEAVMARRLLKRLART